jgi:DNA-binding NarL/FixJ family response regulator
MNIFAKLGVNTRTEAVLTALRAGWIALDDTTP